MKIKAILILIFALFIFCSCANNEEPPIPGPNENGTNPSYDKLLGDTEENGEEAGEEKTDYVSIKSWSSEVNPTYYKTISVKASGYKGNDYPNKTGEYYKLFTSYEQFRSLYDTVENVEPVLFNDFDLLMIYRFYGSRGGGDIGFSEFFIDEDGSAQIKLCERGTTGCVNQVEYKSTLFILVPKQEKGKVEEFKEINIIKDTIYPYKVSFYEDIGIELKGEALFFNDRNSYNSFAEEKGLKKASGYGEISVLIIKNPSSKCWIYGPLSLKENELTLVATKTNDQIGFEQNGYVAIEIERYITPGESNSLYTTFEHTVTKEMSLNIQVYEYPKGEPAFYNESDFGKALYDESKSYTSVQTIYMYFNDRTVIGTRKKYVEGKKVHVVETYITNRDGEITTFVEEMYHDYENECHYEIEDGVWKRKEGNLLTESLFSSIATGNIGQSYSSLSYDIDTGTYYTKELKTYDTFYNFELKFFDGFVMTTSFEQYDENSYEAIYEYNKIVYSNRGNTSVALPEENSSAVKEIEIGQIDEEIARRIAYFDARRHYEVFERRLESTLNYTSSSLSEKEKNDFWYICFYEGTSEYIYKISKNNGEIISTSISDLE